MKFQFNKHFYRYSAFYSMIFGLVFSFRHFDRPFPNSCMVQPIGLSDYFYQCHSGILLQGRKGAHSHGLHLLYRIDCSDCLSEIYFG